LEPNSGKGLKPSGFAFEVQMKYRFFVVIFALDLQSVKVGGQRHIISSEDAEEKSRQHSPTRVFYPSRVRKK
jgi:hypothetical protein